MSGYSSVILADSPLAYWRLNEASGTTAADSSGNAHNGTISGAVTLGAAGLVAGAGSDTAYSFDGTAGTPGQVLTAWNPSGYSAFSVEAWVNFSTIVSGSNPRLIVNSHDDFTGTSGFELFYDVGGAGFHWTVGNGSATGNVVGGAITFGATYHVVGTWDGATVRLYVNGQQVGTPGTLSGGTLAAGPANVGLGYSSDYNGDYLTGALDEVAVYGAALTPTQVQAHYVAGVVAAILGAGAPATSGAVALTSGAAAGAGAFAAAADAPVYVMDAAPRGAATVALAASAPVFLTSGAVLGIGALSGGPRTPPPAGVGVSLTSGPSGLIVAIQE